MTDFLITLPEVAQALRYEGDRAKINARKWLYKHGLKQFATGKYVREQVENILEEKGKKCYITDNAAKRGTSAAVFAWENAPSKSQKDLLGLISLKMQESMEANLNRT